MSTISKYAFISLVILFSNFIVLSDPHQGSSIMSKSEDTENSTKPFTDYMKLIEQETPIFGNPESKEFDCKLCSPCELCINRSCMSYDLPSIFTSDCKLQEHCSNSPCKHGGRCVTSLGVYVCNCMQNHHGKTCSRKVPQGVEDTVTDVHVAYPPMVAAGTPLVVLVAFSDTMTSSSDLTLHYQVTALNIYWVFNRRLIRHRRPRSHCIDILHLDPLYCDTLPDDPSYSVVVVNTEFPFLDQDKADGNVDREVHDLSKGSYTINFTIKFILDTDRTNEPIELFRSDYLQMVYYHDTDVYSDVCFPTAVAVQGSTNCQSNTAHVDTAFELKRSSSFMLKATPVTNKYFNFYSCYTDVSYIMSKLDVNFNPTKDVILQQTTNNWFIVTPFSLPLTEHPKELFRIKIIVKNKLFLSNSYVSNFRYCWIALVKAPLFAQIGGGSLRTVYAYKDLVLSSDLSMDPNFPPNRQQGLFFEWSCNETDIFCKPQTTKAREYVIRPPLRVNVTYLFKLKVYSIHSLPAYHQQEVTVTDVENASFMVECLKNCGDSEHYANPDKIVYLRVNVSGVDAPTDYFQWTYTTNSMADSRIVPHNMRQTNTPDFICIIRDGKLKEGTEYSFVATRSNPRAQADIRIRVGNRSSHAIKDCTITPLSGTQLSTKFNISCNKISMTDKVYYQAYAIDNYFKGLPVYIAILQAPTMVRSLFYDTVQLRAMTSDGSYSIATLQVELTKKELHINSMLQRHCYNSQSKFIPALADKCFTSTLYLCLKMHEQNETCVYKIPGFWDIVLNSISRVRYNRSSYKYLSVLSILTKLIQMNGFPKFRQGKDHQIIMICNIIVDIAMGFQENYFSQRKSFSKDMMFSHSEILQIAKSIYICYITVLEESVFELAEDTKKSKKPDEILLYWRIFLTLFNIIETAISQRLLPVEKPFYLKHKNNSIFIRKEMPDYLSGRLLPPGSGLSSINMNSKLGDYFKNISTFTLLVVEIMDDNEYWWDPDTRITTQVLYTNIQPVNLNGQLVNKFNRILVEEPLDVNLYVKEPEWAEVRGYTTLPTTADLVELDESVAVYKVVPAPQGRGRLFVEFLEMSVDRSLRVVITANFWPDFNYVTNNSMSITNDNNKIDLSYDMYDPDTSLYVGILPGSDSQPGVHRAFTFKSSIVQCYVRTGEIEWVSNSCLVGDNTNDTSVHCQCRELEMVAASTLAPEIRRVQTQRFTYDIDLPVNHLPLKSVSAFVATFILLCLWGCLLDRVLRRQSGIIVLTDNYPGEEWGYLVGVYSGARWNAGTTSNVAIQLIGERGRSRAHVLRHPLRTYSDEWFLLFTPESLGCIMKLRVWVDCGGASPSWYCRKVVVYDWTAKERYVFRLNQWFYLELDGYQLQREVTPRDIRPLEVLVDNLICGAQLMYLPFTIIWHHPRDYLTRLEAITLTSFKMSLTSLLLLLYYKYDNQGLQDYSSYRLLPKDILIGLLFYLITVPLYLIQSMFFKKKFDTSSMTMWTMLGGTLTCNKMIYIGEDKSKTEKREKDEDIVVIEETPTGFTDGKHQSEFRRKHMPVMLNHMLADKVKYSKKTCIAAWAVLLIVFAACCLLMMFLGASMAPVKGQVWLTVSVLSILLGLVFCEPMRVLAYTILSSVIRREVWDNPVICCDPRLAMQLEAVGNSAHLDRLLALRSGPEYLAITKERLHDLREQQEKNQMWRISTGVLWSILIYCILLVISLNKWSAINYYDTSHLTYVVNHPASKASASLADIKNMSVLLSYINNSLVPVFYKPTWYNGEPLVLSNSRFFAKTMVDDFVSKSFGTIMLRQKRTKKTNCILQIMRHLFPDNMCAPRLSGVSEDRENYTIGWQELTPTDYRHKQTPWTYLPGVRLTPIMYGQSGEYYGEGGYVLSLGNSEMEAANILWKMQNADWFDHLTRAIFVKICVFNINTNKFSIISLCMEIRRTIGVDIKIKVVTIPYIETANMTIFKELLKLTVIIILIIWITKDIISIQQLGMEFFYSFWNLFDLLIAGLLICNFLYIMATNTEAKDNIKSFLETDRLHGFPNYQWSSLGGETFNELWYVLLVVASAVMLLKHCGDCISITAVMMTLVGVLGPVVRVCLMVFPLMYIHFQVIDSLLFSYRETTDRLPLVNGNGLKTYANSYTFVEYSFVPYLYCHMCVLIIVFMSVLISHHYKLAKHSAERLKRKLSVVSYLKRKMTKRLRRNREQERRLRGGADKTAGGAISIPTLDAVCLMVIQESATNDDECTLKNIKNFVNVKIKYVKKESHPTSMNKVYKNMDRKLDKIIDSLTKFCEECEF